MLNYRFEQERREPYSSLRDTHNLFTQAMVLILWVGIGTIVWLNFSGWDLLALVSVLFATVFLALRQHQLAEKSRLLLEEHDVYLHEHLNHQDALLADVRFQIMKSIMNQHTDQMDALDRVSANIERQITQRQLVVPEVQALTKTPKRSKKGDPRVVTGTTSPELAAINKSDLITEQRDADPTPTPPVVE